MRQWFFIGLLITVFVTAVWRGGRSERTVAIICVVAAYSTHLTLSAFEHRYQQVEVPIVLIDGATFLCFSVVALFSTKFWPLWVAGMQGVALISHLARLFPDIIPWAYGNAVALWSWPIVGLLGVATWQNERSRQALRRSLD